MIVLLFADLENEVANCLKEWQIFISKGDQVRAKNLLQKAIRRYKAKYQKIGPGVNPKERNKLLIFAIIFRGLLDYLELLNTLAIHDWYKKPKCVEKAWIQLCDCKDRLRYISRFYNNGTVESVIKSIGSIEQIFEKIFGKGLYMSIDASAEKELCNICGNDIRTCSHIEGEIYDGNICVPIPQNLRGRAVALVENPADPRCRIWPWNSRDEGDTIVNECTILTCFSVDDFINEE